jgi:hypothetical protein
MVLAASRTFDYVAIVPERSGDTDFECRARLRDPLAIHRLGDSWLVGITPVIRVTDAGLTPDAHPARPWVMRSRITLLAPEPRQASAAEASFHVDQALTSCMKPGDEIHLTRTGCAGLGLSVMRGGELIVAAGAVTRVPLGQKVSARIPIELIADAEAVFRKRDQAFKLPHLPIEVSVVDSRTILYGGRRTLDDYEVFVVHGFRRGLPGTDECAAIYDHRYCPDTAAHASAMLMADPASFAISRWE